MTTQKVVFISACVSIFVSLLSAFLNHYLTKRRDRKKKLWELDVERVQKIDELACNIYDVLEYNTPLEIKLKRIPPLLEEFAQNEKFLLKYKGLHEALFEFQNGAHYILDAKFHKKVDPKDEKNFEKTYSELLSACKLVLKGKGKWTGPPLPDFTWGAAANKGRAWLLLFCNGLQVNAVPVRDSKMNLER